MLAFGLNKKLCSDFLKKQATIGNLDEGKGWDLGGGRHLPGLAGTLWHHPSSSFLLLPRAIQAAERPHRADGHRVAARPARHSGSETAAGAVGEKKGPRINLGCSGVARALTELPPTCMTTRQPLELRRGQPVEVGAKQPPSLAGASRVCFRSRRTPEAGFLSGKNKRTKGETNKQNLKKKKIIIQERKQDEKGSSCCSPPVPGDFIAVSSAPSKTLLGGFSARSSGVWSKMLWGEELLNAFAARCLLKAGVNSGKSGGCEPPASPRSEAPGWQHLVPGGC